MEIHRQIPQILKIDEDVLNVLDPYLVSQYNVKDFDKKLAGHIDRTDTSAVPVNERLVQLLNHTTYNTGCADAAVEEATAHIVHSSTGNPNVERTAADGGDDGSADYAVFRSSQFSKEKNLANIALFFPSLFPFGVGGPGTQREVHLSPKKWAKRCLKLFGGTFQRHWGFTAIVYDYTATKEAFAKQYLSMSLRKSTLQAGAWTANDLKT
ncbi:hypothetical protein HDU77_011115, partial [Chytriomyces hyalinus]